MIESSFFVLTLLSALGCGLIAGVFFAFSAFVMKALARRPAREGMAAMQSINVPKNEALASVAPTDPDAVRMWAGYVASWTAWNHVRTAAALGAAASFGVALSY